MSYITANIVNTAYLIHRRTHIVGYKSLSDIPTLHGSMAIGFPY